MSDSNYAIVKTGGKQYRVQAGSTLLVEKIDGEIGSKVSLEPVLLRTGKVVTGAKELGKLTVEAKVVGHEKGPKLRVFKFKPKRGYKRRTGHRQTLTRLEIIKLPGATSTTKKTANKAEEANK